MLFASDRTDGGAGKLQMRSKNPYLCNQFLGVLSAGRRVAEKIPAEPDQGNACAGKVISSYLYSSPFRGVAPGYIKPSEL